MVLRASCALTFLASATLLNAASIARTEPAWMEGRENSTRLLGGLAANITGEDQEFDYVVIGAGTAGLTIAARLAEIATAKVAVVEAGSFYELTNAPISSTPFGDVVGAGSDVSDANPAVDWLFVTTTQPGAANREIHYARGKTLGGSSARNFMIYQRPSVQSLQMWADEVEDETYTWDNFLPYFKKSVHFTPPNTEIRAANASVQYKPAAFDSNGGPLQVSYPNYAQPFSSYLEGGFKEIGIPTVEDFNSGSLMGAQWSTATIDPNGEQRSSSQESFLTSCANMTNLKVFQLTMAKQIYFDSNKKATGVQVAIDGLNPFTLKANKEVIVSAGAFQSPQMLMVSGIGPKETLEKFGISVIVDNPNVGQNMWDHVFVNPAYPIGTDSVTRIMNDADYAAAELAAYQADQTGPYTSNIADFLAWEKVPADLRQNFSEAVNETLAKFPEDWPEIEYISAAGYLGNWSAPDTTQPSSGNYASLCAAVVAPMSRGNITISSADMSDAPIINPNWLTAPSDQALLLAGFKRVRQLFASSSVQKVVVGEEYFPAGQYETDEEFMEMLQENVMTVWHAACTCKMGRSDDPKAVVDTQARVLGVQGVRVVDASSFPILPPGHPQSVIYALAEKIADDIKLEHFIL